MRVLCLSESDGGVREVGAERFLSELRWAGARGYATILLTDAALNHDTGHLQAACGTLADACRGGPLRVATSLQWESLDEDQFCALERFRFDDLTIGLESTHDPARRVWGKRPFRPEAFKATMARLHAQGHGVTVSIVLGLPGDTVSTFRETLGYLDGLQADLPGLQAAVSWLSVFPGSPLDRDREKHRLQTAPLGRPFVLGTSTASFEELRDMARDALARQSRVPEFRCEEFLRMAVDPDFDVAALIERRPPFPSTRTWGHPGHAPMVPGRNEPRVRLLAPWFVGEARLGWILAREEAGPVPGGGSCFVFSRESAEVYVEVVPRRAGVKAYSSTKSHCIFYRSDSSGAVPPGELTRLMNAVTLLVRRNEAKSGTVV